MKSINYLFILLAFCIGLLSCKQDQVNTVDPETTTQTDGLNLRTQMIHYIDSVFSTESIAVDSVYNGDRIYADAQTIADQTPGDSISAEVLFRAGALLKGRKEPTKAIGVWGLVTEKYPDSYRSADALFQQALTFDNDLNDKNLAKRYYQKFLEQYPEHPQAEDVRLLLPMMDKTDAELVEEFEKKLN